MLKIVSQQLNIYSSCRVYIIARFVQLSFAVLGWYENHNAIMGDL